MDALVCSNLSGSDGLAVRRIPRPGPGPGEVLIEAQAWGLNYADALMSRGQYQTRREPPFVAGCEVSGVVVDTASDVSGIEKGDRVAALAPGDGFADFVCVDARRVMPLSNKMDFATGAGFYAGYATAMHALLQRGHLSAGETMMVLAAGGGTGLAAVDIGRALGAQVIGVAGSPEKLALAAERGALTINYRSADVAAEIRRLTDGRDLDVVFDPVGGDLFDLASRRVRWNGRYLVVGFASGRIPQFAVNLCLVKGYSLVGVFADEFMRREPEASLTNACRLNTLYDAGRLNPSIEVLDKMEAIPAALEAIERGRVLGKMVVRRG